MKAVFQQRPLAYRRPSRTDAHLPRQKAHVSCPHQVYTPKCEDSGKASLTHLSLSYGLSMRSAQPSA